MHIAFGAFAHPATGAADAFAAAVVIQPDAWPALEIGAYESIDRVSPCFAWCVARFGQGGTRWLVRFDGEDRVRILFQQAEDAIAFHAAWAAARLPRVSMAA